MNPRRSNRSILWIALWSTIAGTLVIANVLFTMITHIHWRSGVNALDFKSNDYIGTEVLEATRGIIYDRKKDILVQDQETYNLYAVVDESRLGINNVPAYVENYEKTAAALAPILGLEQNEITQILQYAKDNGMYQTYFGNAGNELSVNTKKEIEALEIAGLEFEKTSTRYYNYGKFASTTLGFTRYDDVEEVTRGTGLEYVLDETLTGTDGILKYQKNSYGYKLAGTEYIEKTPVNGKNVVLTLDSSVQMALENALQKTLDDFKAERAWGIIMEVETGKILGYASAPSFDLNDLSSIEEYRDLNAQFLYEPGSVIKGLTYAAAIDSGNYPEGKTYRAGSFYFGYDQANDKIYRVDSSENSIGKIGDALGKDYNTLTFDEGFLRSSNIAIAELLSNYMPKDVWKEYLDRFHMGEYTVDIPFISNLAGSYNFNLPIEILSTGFGQGINITALQMCQAYTAIFNDGKMMRPYIVDRIENPYDNSVEKQWEPEVIGTPIQPETSQKLRDLMYQVVENEVGTAYGRYTMDDVDLIAKTGTGEIYDQEHGGYRTDLYTNSIMAAAPYDDPKIMMYYVFQSKDILNFTGEPFKEAFKAALVAANISSNATNKEADSKDYETWESYTMPSLVNHSLEYAKNKINDFKVDQVIIGDGTSVVKQYPEANTSISSNQLMFLVTDGSKFTMPNMIGWTRKDVVTFSELTNIPIEIQGTGKVKEQSIAEGQVMTSSDELTVLLE